jgi:predicted Zn-dependent peptidase
MKSEDALQRVIEALTAHVEELKTKPIDPARLAAVVSHLRYRFVVALDTPDAIAARVSHYVGLTGSIETIDQLFQRYAEIKPADIQRVAGHVFRPANQTLVTLSHGARGEPASR